MNSLLDPGVNVIVDGQWGSTGKGKLGAFLADTTDVAVGTADFQSNAGHTVVINGRKIVVNHIPSAFVNRSARLYLAPAATITVQTLLKELEALEDYGVRQRLTIHPNVGVIEQEDVAKERQSMGSIASTMKGVGAALARKVQRHAVLARDCPELQPHIGDMTATLAQLAKGGAKILAETSQGWDLSLNHGWRYPFVTSRDVCTSSILSNLGIPPTRVARVWGCIRALPIRVGHLMVDGKKMGDSGPCYSDQREMSWDEVQQSSGAPTSVMETTTVTGRVRRVFSWSWLQFARFIASNDPSDLFLNFANHIDWNVHGAREQRQVEESHRVAWFLSEMRSELVRIGSRARVSLIGTGPDHLDIVRMQ